MGFFIIAGAHTGDLLVRVHQDLAAVVDAAAPDAVERLFGKGITAVGAGVNGKVQLTVQQLLIEGHDPVSLFRAQFQWGRRAAIVLAGVQWSQRFPAYVHDGDKEYFLHIQDPFCVLFGRVSGQTC